MQKQGLFQVPVRLSIKPQTVKMRYSIKKSYGFKLGEFYPSLGGWFHFFKTVKSLLRKHFDFLHKLRPTVPMYAYGRSLFDFWPFLTPCQCVKKHVFWHTERSCQQAASLSFPKEQLLHLFQKKFLTDLVSDDIIASATVPRHRRQNGPLAQLVRASGS